MSPLAEHIEDLDACGVPCALPDAFASVYLGPSGLTVKVRRTRETLGVFEDLESARGATTNHCRSK